MLTSLERSNFVQESSNPAVRSRARRSGNEHHHVTGHGVRPVQPGVPGRPVPGVPLDARPGPGVPQREVELVGPVPVRGRAGRGDRSADVPQLRGHRHRRHGQGPERPRVPAGHRQPAARPDPPDDPAAAAPQPHRRAGRRGPAGGARAHRRLAAPGHGRPGPGTGLAHAQRGVLRPARPARRPGAGTGPAEPLDPRAEGPPARRLPPDAGGQGGHGRDPGLLHRSAARTAGPAARGPGDPPRHRADRRGAVRRGGLRGRLRGARADDGAVPRRGGEHRWADRDAVQAAGRAPGPAGDPAGRTGADPGRGRRGDPAGHPAAAGRPDDQPRSLTARGHDPGRRPGGAGLRGRQPRRAPLRRPGPVRRHPGALPAPRIRRGDARLPGGAAGPAGGEGRPGGGAARAGRLHDHRAAGALPDHAEHVRLGPPQPGLPGRRCGRAASAGGDRPPHHHQRHRAGPGVRGRRPGGAEGRGRRRRGRADPAAAHRRAAATVVAGRARRPDPGRRADPAVLAVRRPGRPPPVAAGRPARRRGRRWFAVRPRPAAAGRHGPGPRAAQQLRAAGRAALPVRRGRDRHHADPADDRGGVGGRGRLAPAVRRPPPGLDGLPARTGPVRRPGHGGAAGRDRAAGPGRLPRPRAAGHADLLLRSRAPAGRGGGMLPGLAAPDPAGRAVQRPAADRAGPGAGLRGGAGPQRAHADRSAGPLRPRRGRSGRGGSAVLLRRGHLRDV